MGTQFNKCPNSHCDNTKNGSWVYECSNCGHLMCYYDDGLFVTKIYGCWKGDRCPNCASHKKEDGIEIIKAIGKIYSR